MPLSILTSTYTSGPQVFDASFALGVLKPEHLSAYVVGEIDGEGAQVYRPFVWNKLAQTMTITTPLTNGDVVVRARTVPKEILLTSFQAGADVTKRNLDFNSLHLIHAIHEILDNRVAGFEVNANLEEIFAQIVDLAADASQSAIDAAASAALANSSLYGLGTAAGRYFANTEETIAGGLMWGNASTSNKPTGTTEIIAARIGSTAARGGLITLDSQNSLWTRYKNTTWGLWRSISSTWSGEKGSDLTFTIGSGGDFSELRDAIHATMWFRHLHRRIILIMLEGYQIHFGVEFPTGDFSMYRIQNWAGIPNEDGSDPVVPTELADDFAGVSLTGDMPAMGNDWYERSGILFAGGQTMMPHIQCVIDCRQKNQGSYVLRQGSGTIWPKCGFINSGYTAVSSHTAIIWAHAAILNGAGGHAVRCAYGGVVNCQQAEMEDCCWRAEVPAGAGAVDCSRSSVVHARLGKLSRSHERAINCRRNSTVCFEEITAADCKFGGVVFSGASKGSGFGCVITNAGVGGVGGSGSGRGVQSRTMSCVSVDGGTITGSEAGDPPADLEVEVGGLISAKNVTLSGGLNSTVNLYGRTAYNSLGGAGVIFNDAVG